MSIGIRKNSMTDTQNFEDIRPYTDAEIPAVFTELLNDDEFLRGIVALRFSWMPTFIYPFFKPILKWRLSQYAEQFKTVADFQNTVETYLQRAMDSTSDSLVFIGEDKLELDKQYLFISNHRDIVMDPALCNIAIHRIGRKTHRIAIGDNLLSKPFAEHLMRINKSFIVKRAVGSGREKLRELKKLSAYIRHSISVDSECVWIAQREGRAKNGIDSSDPALIKMLTLAKSKTESFSEAIQKLNIMPVAVSYEWDPCDLAKARELATKQENGEYLKTEHEDIESIAAGIQGFKGAVRLAFGEPLTGEYESAEEVARDIDDQILSMYQIHASNLSAYRKIFNQLPDGITEDYSEEQLAAADAVLAARTSQLSESEATILLKTYANPVISRLKLMEERPENATSGENIVASTTNSSEQGYG